MGAKPSEFPNLPERLSGPEKPADNRWWRRHPGAGMLFKGIEHITGESI